jgi:hypothetical protein
MTTHHTANGLASLGRHGDTMLVHMSPEEVHGLESIARLHGTKLTRNPETGMPEAFSLGGFFKSFLPTIAGLGISAMFPGASPWLIGTLAGVGTTLATGNPLTGIMTGLGVGGGMGIGEGVFNIGENLASNAGQEVAQSVAQSEAAKLGGAAAAGEAVSPFVNNPSMIAQQASTASALPSYTNQLGAFNNPSFNTATMQAPQSAVIGQNVNTFTKGLGESFSNPSKLINEVGGMKLAAPLIGGVASGVEQKDILGYDPNASQSYYDPDTGKWRTSSGGLKLSADTGLRLPMYAAKGGEVQSYAVGGNVANQSTGAGISDLYNASDNVGGPNISQDGYGIGRLSSLANAEAMNTAKTLGYAEGGETHLNLDQLPSLNINSNNSNTPQGLQGIQKFIVGERMNSIDPSNVVGNFMSRLLRGDPEMVNTIRAARAAKMSDSSASGLAKGGYLDGAGDGMSDSIPATIEGKQPARLADGEFVVPADVVSHIGNGSSKAGSKRLYTMLNKVRKARTGNPKQGKQINPDKYMPA